MSKILKKQVFVRTRGDLPRRVFFRKEWMVVERIMEHWRETGRWWENETERDFFLVQTAKGGFLLCRENSTDRWVLYKALD
jgi:hypothetical protein